MSLRSNLRPNRGAHTAESSALKPTNRMRGCYCHMHLLFLSTFRKRLPPLPTRPTSASCTASPYFRPRSQAAAPATIRTLPSALATLCPRRSTSWIEPPGAAAAATLTTRWRTAPRRAPPPPPPIPPAGWSCGRALVCSAPPSSYRLSSDRAPRAAPSTGSKCRRAAPAASSGWRPRGGPGPHGRQSRR